MSKGLGMAKTTWPFVEWTEIIGAKGQEELHVVEEVIIGEDATKLDSEIIKVEIFSTCFKPFMLSAKGNKLVGILAENRKGEYFYSAFFEGVKEGEKKKFEVAVKGESTIPIMKKDGYYSNFAWNTKHVERVVFPKGTAILSAVPKGYRIETFKGRPCVVWRRDGKYWGDVQVKLTLPSSTSRRKQS